MEGAPRSFESFALPHLDAAFTYARWLTGDRAQAEDIVQDAFVRALQYFSTMRGDNPRAWLLAIVRNTFHSRRRPPEVSFDPARHDRPAEGDGPEAQLLVRARDRIVHEAIASLALEFREVLVLREFEGLSYREIAEVAGVPVGTVMSRLARARDRIAAQIEATRAAGGDRGLL